MPRFVALDGAHGEFLRAVGECVHGGFVALPTRHLEQCGAAGHPQVALCVGSGAPGVSHLAGDGVELLGERVVAHQVWAAAHDEPLAGVGHKIVAPLTQREPLGLVATEFHHVAVAGQKHVAAYRRRVGHEKVVGGHIFHRHAVDEQSAVERAHDHAPLSIHTEGAHHVVRVVEAVVDKGGAKEQIGALIGGKPHTVPAVHQQVLDEIVAARELFHPAVVELVEAVFIGDVERSVPVGLGQQAIVGVAELMARQELQFLAFNGVDAVARQGIERAGAARKGIYVGLVANFPVSVSAHHKQAVAGGHIGRLVVDKEFAVGCESVEHLGAHQRFHALLGDLAQPAMCLFLVFHEYHRRGQGAAVEVVEQPVLCRVQLPLCALVAVDAPLAHKSQCAHAGGRGGKPHDVFAPAFQEGGERAPVVARKARQRAHPHIALAVLPDGLYLHLRQTVERGEAMATQVTRHDGLLRRRDEGAQQEHKGEKSGAHCGFLFRKSTLFSFICQ